MKRTYTNPAYPLENNLRTFSEPLILSGSLNYKQLDETKIVTDIFVIYFYTNKKTENII